MLGSIENVPLNKPIWTVTLPSKATSSPVSLANVKMMLTRPLASVTATIFSNSTDLSGSTCPKQSIETPRKITRSARIAVFLTQELFIRRNAESVEEYLQDAALNVLVLGEAHSFVNRGR